MGPEDASVALPLTAGISDETAGTVFLKLQCTAVPTTIEVPASPISGEDFVTGHVPCVAAVTVS